MTSYDPTAPVPSYAELCEKYGGTAWDVFGRDDQLGALNFLTSERVRSAAGAVRSGRVFNLDYPLDAFASLMAARPAPKHTIFVGYPHERDDFLSDLYLQGTTQIDGLRHMAHATLGFYGGRGAVGASEDSLETFPGTCEDLGIHHWAERGIVGRGVLADVARYRESMSRPLAMDGSDAITVDDLDGTLQRQETVMSPGDILLLRTGWAEYYLEDLDDRGRAAVAAGNPIATPGLRQSEETVAWLWDHQIVMVAADNTSVEVTPPRSDSPFQMPPDGSEPVMYNGNMHRILIPLLGLALGELFLLDELAEDCEADHIYECMVVAKPLNLVGGVGSPANAVALK